MVLSNILKDKYLRIVLGISLAILIIGFLVAAFKLISAPYPLIIHFDNYSGVDFFGGKVQVFEILILAGIIVLINSFLADFLYFKERFISYLFVFGGLGISILILMAMGVIIAVN